MTKDHKPYGAKPPLYLLPLKLLWGAAKVLAHGKDKHGAWNYMEAESTVEAAEEYLSACLRHLSDMSGPGKLGAVDRDSGLMAIDHALVNLMIAKHHITKMYGESGESKYESIAAADLRLLKEANKQYPVSNPDPFTYPGHICALQVTCGAADTRTPALYSSALGKTGSIL